MAIAKRTPLYLQSLLLAGSISLVACGGGGSSSPKDTTPDAISFTASTNAQPNATVSSPAVAISGIDAQANVSITGGEYSINGGAFTSAAGKISNGQSLVVRVTASDKTNTAKTATVTVGGVNAQFSVTTLADTTPASFTLAPVTNAALGAAVTSSSVTLSGFDIAVPLSITGGEYSINGGAFTSAAGTVSPSQSVAVKLTASNSHSTVTNAQLTVGGVSASFSVTTLPDSTPDTFSFTTKTNAALNTVYTSDAITVKGIDTAVPVSIAGGEYSVNGAAFTSVAGTVSVNDSVTVRATAANGTELTHNAVLTIGNVPATFAITTIPDTTAPIAQFKFPTPYTMSEASSVKVRGTATDEHAIASVKLVVSNSINNTVTEIDAIPKSDINGVKDFSSWTATIPLTAIAENEIKVIATDDRNNTTVTANANKVQIRQADVRSAFPDTVNETEITSVVLDKYDGRNRALVADSTGGNKQVIAIDLTTGSRTLAFTTPDCSLFALTIDPVTKHLYGVCNKKLYEFNLSDGVLINSYDVTGATGGATIRSMALDRNNGRSRLILGEPNASNTDETGKVFAFSLETKTTSTISPEDQLPLFVAGQGMLVHGDQYLIADGDVSSDFGSRIIAVDAISGNRSIFSDNSIGSGDSYGGTGYRDVPLLSSVVKDEKLNRLFVFEFWSSRIFTVDLTTFNRKIFSNPVYKQAGIIRDTADVLDMEIDEQQELLVLAESGRNAIIIVDMETSEKAILSKSTDTRD